jgi:hypothetical protein
MTTTDLTADIRGKDTAALLDLFATLECPPIVEMDGEYRASLLRQANLLVTVGANLALTNLLRQWQCKAFRPVDDNCGRGYNTFRQLGRTVQRYPMITRIAASRFDGRPAYHLIYRAFHSLCGEINMVDEVRRLAPGTYLGIGTLGFTDTQRRVAHPFLLEHTGQPYRGDVGRVRNGFTPGARPAS